MPRLASAIHPNGSVVVFSGPEDSREVAVQAVVDMAAVGWIPTDAGPDSDDDWASADPTDLPEEGQ